MSLDSSLNQDKISQEDLQQFIVLQIQQQIKKLNSVCFERCIEKPGSKLESKQQTCIENCVGRYFDTNGFIANRFVKRTAAKQVPSDSFT